ncbi:sulfite oxidase [bacterium]|nr:sulfite oxidase [bacterium]MCI0607290.1 sulfite oxidase [bacterium]
MDELNYIRERVEEFAWQNTKRALTRRRFLHLLGWATAAASMPIIAPWKILNAENNPAILKPSPSDLFIQSGSNLEMRWEAMYSRGYIVPNELFFVRNNSPSVPSIDLKTWRLIVEGSGVSNPRSFRYDEILAMPSISVIRAIECAGNGRSLFELSHGKKIAGTPWKLGGIGVAEWTGVPLREVLQRAGVKKTARDVMPEGLDEKKIKRPMPIEKAMAEDTLLVYGMNGNTLPPDHGFPFRVLVPGWVGISHIKWVGRVEVSEQRLYSEYNTKRYVLIGPDYQPVPPALGAALTTQKVKSAFELAWDGQATAGKQLLRGRSWSGEGSIAKVDVSLDGGRKWQAARLREPNIPLAWVRWDLEWDARPGSYGLQARATDSKGNTQPDRIPPNEEGYSHWAVVTHPFTIKS